MKKEYDFTGGVQGKYAMRFEKGTDLDKHADPFFLDRFVTAQEPVYHDVLSELKSAEKRTHWMWFVFPQLDGLGSSPHAVHFAIKSLEEAESYLSHPLLGSRLRECTGLVMAARDRFIDDIFGFPDNLKFRSSMTLFSCVEGADPVFASAIDHFFAGEPDPSTLELLGIEWMCRKSKDHQ